MAIHAASHHDVDVVGVTISDEQAIAARERVERAGLSDRVEIRVQDYREVDDGPYDAISSIGMAEHVGRKNLPTYFARLYSLLRPGGRLVISDIVLESPLPDAIADDIGSYVGCVAGAQVRDAYFRQFDRAGLELSETIKSE